MDKKRVEELLDLHEACLESKEWIVPKKDLADIWATCDVPEWLVWLAVRVGVSGDVIRETVRGCYEVTGHPYSKAIEGIPKGLDQAVKLIARLQKKYPSKMKEMADAVRERIPPSLIESHS